MSDQCDRMISGAANSLQVDISALLISVLGLPEGAIPVHPDTRLLGVIPELDSMSVVAFLISLEEQYDILIHDDEMDAAVFESVGSLTDFVKAKLN